MDAIFGPEQFQNEKAETCLFDWVVARAEDRVRRSLACSTQNAEAFRPLLHLARSEKAGDLYLTRVSSKRKQSVEDSRRYGTHLGPEDLHQEPGQPPARRRMTTTATIVLMKAKQQVSMSSATGGTSSPAACDLAQASGSGEPMHKAKDGRKKIVLRRPNAVVWNSTPLVRPP